MPLGVRDFKAGLSHRLLLRDYNVGVDWAVTDGCLTQTYTLTHKI